MLELSAGIRLPDSADMRNVPVETDFIEKSFDSEAARRITDLLSANKRLPQEIVTYKYLCTTMK
ncbi:MAG: hypothetical protein Q4F95_05275 [Oscillospiraceae bacterium]|nr:hypothetical protein [Oscillospiraceae bacterium]